MILFLYSESWEVLFRVNVLLNRNLKKKTDRFYFRYICNLMIHFLYFESWQFYFRWMYCQLGTSIANCGRFYCQLETLLSKKKNLGVYVVILWSKSKKLHIDFFFFLVLYRFIQSCFLHFVWEKRYPWKIIFNALKLTK